MTVTSSNSTILSKPIVLKIALGADYATTYLTTNMTGLTSLTASSPGLGSSSLTLRAVSSPATENIAATSSLIFANETSTIIASVQAFGAGVPGAQVQWFTSFGTLTATNSTTNSAGTATVTFDPSGFTGKAPLVADIRALVTSPFTGSRNLTTTIVVQPVPVPPTKSFYQDIQPYLVYIIIAIVIVVAVVFYFFFFRKWRQKKSSAGPQPEETEPYDELEEIPGGGEPGEPGAEEAGPPAGENPPDSPTQSLFCPGATRFGGNALSRNLR